MVGGFRFTLCGWLLAQGFRASGFSMYGTVWFKAWVWVRGFQALMSLQGP